MTHLRASMSPVWPHTTTAACTARWIDADQPADEIWADIQAMLEASPENERVSGAARHW